jgi:hypothetical protein
VQADVERQAGDGRLGSLDERAFEHLIDLRRAGGEGAEAAGLVRAGELADGLGGAVEVGVEVEGRAVGPAVTGQGFGAADGEMPVQRRARALEQGVEDPAHGEDGGA